MGSLKGAVLVNTPAGSKRWLLSRLWCSSSQSQELLELVNCEAVSREETSVPSPTRSPSTGRLEARSTMETMETTTATMGRPLSWRAGTRGRELMWTLASLRLLLLDLVLMARGASTRWRWWRRPSTTTWCSATTPTTGGVTPPTPPTTSPSRRRTVRRTSGRTFIEYEQIAFNETATVCRTPL